MILNIQQIKSNFDMKWLAFDKNEEIFSCVEAPFVTGKFEAKATFYDSNTVNMYYNPYDNSYGTKWADRLSFKFLSNNALVGNVVGKTKKVGFLKSYPYYEMTFNNETYYGYEVGFGSQGLFLCIYKGDELIAIVDKKLRVINYKDSYTAYIKDESYAIVTVLLVTYYDVITYGDLLQIALFSLSEKRVNTFQKDLIAKYDPDFIPRIKTQDGIVD